DATRSQPVDALAVVSDAWLRNAHHSRTHGGRTAHANDPRLHRRIRRYRGIGTPQGLCPIRPEVAVHPGSWRSGTEQGKSRADDRGRKRVRESAHQTKNPSVNGIEGAGSGATAQSA